MKPSAEVQAAGLLDFSNQRNTIGHRVRAITVNDSVAGGAQGDEILLAILTLPAPELDVMDLEIRYGSARLASPPIALQHSYAELLIGMGIQASSLVLPQPSHAAWATARRNSCFSASGSRRNKRSMENSSTLGLPFSSCAPARKSAQIISRQ